MAKPSAGALPGDDHGDGKLQGEQAAGIVDQAFPFQNVNNASRKAKALGDGAGGDRIGG